MRKFISNSEKTQAQIITSSKKMQNDLAIEYTSFGAANGVILFFQYVCTDI